MIDLDKLQEMWEKDSKIDMNNLHTESTNIPTLHAKYFDLYNTIFLMRKKAEQQKKISDTKDTNTIQERQTQIFTCKIPFLKKSETRTR